MNGLADAKSTNSDIFLYELATWKRDQYKLKGTMDMIRILFSHLMVPR